MCELRPAWPESVKDSGRTENLNTFNDSSLRSEALEACGEFIEPDERSDFPQPARDWQWSQSTNRYDRVLCRSRSVNSSYTDRR